MTQHLVVYAKINTDKEKIILQGVYFGGTASTFDEADHLARDCVNTIRGGTILPKILQIEGPGQLLDAMFTACEKFEKITTHMIEANETITRTNRRKTAKVNQDTSNCP